MTTGVEIAVSRDRNAFPRCHASSALKWESTRVASVLAMVSSYRIGGISFVLSRLPRRDVHLLEGLGLASLSVPYWDLCAMCVFECSRLGMSLKWGWVYRVPEVACCIRDGVVRGALRLGT